VTGYAAVDAWSPDAFLAPLRGVGTLEFVADVALTPYGGGYELEGVEALTLRGVSQVSKSVAERLGPFLRSLRADSLIDNVGALETLGNLETLELADIDDPQALSAMRRLRAVVFKTIDDADRADSVFEHARHAELIDLGESAPVTNAGLEWLNRQRTGDDWHHRGSRVVHLRGGQWTDVTAAGLARLKPLRSVQIVDCQGLNVRTIEHLHGASRVLLSSCRGVTDGALAHIAWARDVSLSDCTGMHDAGIARLSAVTSLDVSYTRVTDDGLRTLAPRLVALNVVGAFEVTAATLRRCTRLRTLFAEDAQTQEASAVPSTVQRLALSNAGSTDSREMIHLTHLTSLKELEIEWEVGMNSIGSDFSGLPLTTLVISKLCVTPRKPARVFAHPPRHLRDMVMSCPSLRRISVQRSAPYTLCAGMCDALCDAGRTLETVFARGAVTPDHLRRLRAVYRQLPRFGFWDDATTPDSNAVGR
jgi:hypothetical protein